MGASMFANLESAIGLILVVSIASERLVEIVKGVLPWLNTERSNSVSEGYRRALLQLLAVAAGIFTAFLASPIIAADGQDGLTRPGALLGIGLLASGGSGLWNAVLGYFLQIKDLKKQEVVQAKSSALLNTSGVYEDLRIAEEQVTSNTCYDVGE